ncbi:hypothetical protein PENSPDRAFT_341349 [Peniophora sp. CONT]|nr:hypothetical protein PENSPDRAFT_341349 [Peniophora sp. CONT]
MIHVQLGATWGAGTSRLADRLGHRAPRKTERWNCNFEYTTTMDTQSASSTDSPSSTQEPSGGARKSLDSPAASPCEPNAQSDRILGDTLFSRYRSHSSTDDLDSSIAAFRRAFEVVSVDPSDERLLLLNNFSAALDARFRLSGNPSDIDDAIKMQLEVVDRTPEDDPDKALCLGNLGAALWSRYKRFGNATDLETALVAKHRAVHLTPDGEPLKSHWLANLAASLSCRFDRYGEVANIEEAIMMQRRAVELTPDDDPTMPGRLISLGVYLDDRFQHSGEISYSDDALEAIRRAVELTPEGHSSEARLQGNLGAALWARFERFGHTSDIEDAIVAKRRAVELTADGHPNKPRWLTNLGASLLSRFENFGDTVDLESAIEARRTAVQLTPDDHPEAPPRFAYLGISLRARFLRFGDAVDLESALEVERRAVDLTPDDHPNKPLFLANLGVFLNERFNLSHSSADIQGAIEAQRRAVELTPDEHPQKPVRLTSLGNCFHNRFHHVKFREPTDLDSAVDAERRAVQLVPVGHPSESRCLGNLSVSLRRRFEYSGDPVDLEDALAAARRAVELLPKGHPDLVSELKRLGDCLYSRFKRDQSRDGFKAALDCFMLASSQPLVAPDMRFEALESGVWMLSHHSEFSTSESIMHAHARVIGILPELVWLGHTVQRRFEESSRVGKLVYAAVRAAIEAGALYQAVEWLEAGRSLVWSQVISMRSPLDDLEEHHPDLAQALRAIQLALQKAGRADTLSPTAHHGAASAMISNDIANKHRQLVIQYERLLESIRRCAGFESFLQPMKFQALSAALGPAAGLIVFLNMTPSRCDALVVDGQSVQTVALPTLTEERATELRRRWWSCLHTRGVRERAMAPARVARRGTKEELQLVLERLWIWIVHPVLQAMSLIHDGEYSGSLPHVTWCPTGPLMQLPLHAAGLYSSNRPSQLRGPRVFDFIVSSYTPSLTALGRGFRKENNATSAPKVLIVTQPGTPGQSPLPCTLEEAAKIRAILPEEGRTWLDHERATVEPVLAAINQHEWVHFACHGSQNTEDPTLSAFMLYDGPLTLSRLMNTVSDNAELAFLSACQTATGNEKIPEESMHLAAGMLAVGFKGVIATMWSIQDQDAPVIVEAYYKKLLELRNSGGFQRGHTGAASALHEATELLRGKIGEDAFERWVPFVHFGA